MLKLVFLKTYRALLYWSSIIWSKLSAFRRISVFALFAEDEANFDLFEVLLAARLLLAPINTKPARTYHAKRLSYLGPALGFLWVVRPVFFNGWRTSSASPSSKGIKVSHTLATLNHTSPLLATYLLQTPFFFLSSQASQVRRKQEMHNNKDQRVTAQYAGDWISLVTW